MKYHRDGRAIITVKQGEKWQGERKSPADWFVDDNANPRWWVIIVFMPLGLLYWAYMMSWQFTYPIHKGRLPFISLGGGC